MGGLFVRAENGTRYGFFAKIRQIWLFDSDWANGREKSDTFNLKMGEQFLSHKAGRYAGSSFSSRSPSATSVVEDFVFLEIGIVRVAGAVEIFDRFILTAIDLAILNHDRNRRARRFALKYTR